MKAKKIFIWMTRVWLFLLPLQTHLLLQSARLAGHEWPFGEISLYALDVGFFLLVISAFTARRYWKKLPLSYIFGLIIFICLLAVSVFLHHDAKNTWVLFLRYLEGLALVALLAVVPDRTRKLGIAFVAGITAAAAFGIWQFMTQYVPKSSLFGVAEQNPSVAGVSVLLSSAGRFLRAYGTFSHPNIFGGYLAAALLMLLIIVLQRPASERRNSVSVKEFLGRYAWTLVVLLLFGAFTFSFSRSAWIAFAVSLVVLASITVQRNRSYELRVWVLAGIVPIVFLVLHSSVLVPLVSERIVARNVVERVSIENRRQSLVEGYTIFKKYWAEGLGLGRSTYYIAEHSPESLQWWEIQPPHNIFLLLADEASIFTALTFIGVLVFLGRDSLHAVRQQKQNAFPMSALGLTFVALIVVIGLFDHYLLTLPAGFFLTFTLLGFSVRTAAAEAS